MSSYLQSLSTPPSTNPFHIYGPDATDPQRVKPFPIGRGSGLRVQSRASLHPSHSVYSPNSASSGQPVAGPGKTGATVRPFPSQRWEQKKQQINTKTAWILTTVLLVATFVMMVASTLAPPSQNAAGAQTTVAVRPPQHVPALKVLANILPKAKASIISPATIAEPSQLQRRRMLLAPIKRGILSSTFGRRWGRNHQGVDLAATTGSPITAVAPGRVIFSGWEQGYGKTVLIDHGHHVRTRYAHCSSVLVKTHQHVPAGAVIARVGSTGHSTGPHLHFEIIIRGHHQNPARYYRLGSSMSPIANLIE